MWTRGVLNYPNDNSSTVNDILTSGEIRCICVDKTDLTCIEEEDHVVVPVTDIGLTNDVLFQINNEAPLTNGQSNGINEYLHVLECAQDSF